jgi:hypothetical protein
MWPLRRTLLCVPLVALAAILVGLPASAFGEDDHGTFSARFLGVNETPSVSTEAAASLKLKINGTGNTASITYTLTYSGLRAPVTQAHIHFGQTKVAGGVMVFLCATDSLAPTTIPAPPVCPQAGTVTGTLHAADVIDVVGANGTQGIAAGEMGRVVQAIRDGAAYGNVHSTMFPKGEIRGQLVNTDR